MEKVNFYDLDISDLENILSNIRVERYRTKQLWVDVYRNGKKSFGEISTLSNVLRDNISGIISVKRLQVVDIKESDDGTQKILIMLDDGNFIESVLIPRDEYYAICVSSQVGCAMGCKFCCTGYHGFERNLTVGEIVGQYMIAKDLLCDWPVSKTLPKKVKNVVFMGMGEPLLNCENVIKAIKVLSNDSGLGVSQHCVTVSTCGIFNKIKCVSECLNVNLAISLHAANDVLRSKLMPINRKYPLDKLLSTCKEYCKNSGKIITFEYMLINDINDSIDDAKELVKVLTGMRCKINLIAFNEWEKSWFTTPQKEKIKEFENVLKKKGYNVFVRYSSGKDINAACGQLKAKVYNGTLYRQKYKQFYSM